MIKRMILLVLLLAIVSMQAMFYRTTPGRTVYKPVKPKTSAKYQKAVAAQKILKSMKPQIESAERMQSKSAGYQAESIQPKSEWYATQSSAAIIQEGPRDLKSITYPVETESHKQELTVYHKLVHDDKKKDRRWFSFERPSYAEMSWGGLLAALGLGWLLSSEDEEKAKEEAENVLKICRLFSVDPLEKFAQFIRRYGTGAVAEQLFERMIIEVDPKPWTVLGGSFRYKNLLPS